LPWYLLYCAATKLWFHLWGLRDYWESSVQVQPSNTALIKRQ
jgi:hypothetical protein